MRSFLAKNAASLRFVLTFGLLLLLGSLLINSAAFNARVAEPFTAGLARVSAAALRLAGENVTGEGVTIRSGSVNLAIRYNCNGIEAAFIFAASVLAFPAPWKARAVGLAAGSAVLQLVNVVRILALYYVQKFAPDTFDAAHVYVAQAAVIGVAIVLWLVWIERYVPEKPAQIPG